MKKTLVSALTTALVVGAASTTFAAANPFEDVPADHWAYDAVAQLAADGVIEGYGDGTYRGDQEITRYEMAQMVARAMAKGGGDKALIDKLAAEFADELNNLGVRVSALEKKVDNVKWTGKIRYRYAHRTEEHANAADNDDHPNLNQLLLRFEPQMIINEHWTGKARLDYAHTNNMDDAKNEDKVKVERMWVSGDYKNLKINLGKLPYKSQADEGLIMDRNISGGQLIFGSDVKVGLAMGRVHDTENGLVSFGATSTSVKGSQVQAYDPDAADSTASYGSIEIYGDKAKKFTWGLGWHHFRQNQALKNMIDRENYNIFALGLGYKFTPDLRLSGSWSHAFGIDEGDAVKLLDKTWAGVQKNSYSFELAYKGANAKKPGSWGAFVAWRQLGAFSSTGWNTYRLNGPQGSGERGFELGVSWAPMKNVTGIVRWFNGKQMEQFSGGESRKVNSIFTEWNFLF